MPTVPTSTVPMPAVSPRTGTAPTASMPAASGFAPVPSSGRSTDAVPEFDVVLWGYDRDQVDQCLRDLIERLELAMSQLGLVETLQAQLCEAQLEIERLRRHSPQDPSWAPQLASIMAAAEQLRREAAREAEAIRAQAQEQAYAS